MLLFLKLLETRAPRDAFVVAFLVYFVALANFFYSQSIPIAALMLLTVTVATTRSWVQRAATDRIRGSQDGRRMLAQAGPVMLLLFFLFPRVQGPLWGLPQDAYTGVTGLSERCLPARSARCRFRTRSPSGSSSRRKRLPGTGSTGAGR